MAYDAFLELDGIKGESTRKGYETHMPIFSFSWGTSNPATVGVIGGQGGGKCSISDLNVMKKADAASPLLFQACAQGTHIKKGKLTLLKAGGQGASVDFVVYTLSDCYLSSVQYSGSEGGDDTPTESISISFAKMEYTFTPQKPDGSKGTPVVGSWDQTKVSDK